MVEPVVEAARVSEFQAPFNNQTIGFEVRAGLNELCIKSAELTEDIINLANLFLDQFEIQEANLRIEITRTQTCPKFHCDNLNIRMLATYLGPTTEYQFASEETIHSAPVGGLVFLKGRQHPQCNGSVLHRSPEVPSGTRRLCVAIDY